MSTYIGQCLCGGIKFEIDKLGSKMGHCHCSMCQKFHGAAFSTFGEAKHDDFRWLEGQDLLKTFTAKNQTKRKFCCECGSSLIFESAGDEHDVIEFALACLDKPPKISPDAHIFVSTQVSWVEVNDSLPRYLNQRTKS